MAIPMLLVTLLVGWVFLIHRVIPAPPLVISEETTRITGPLTADGQIDFLKALEELTYPPELATDENGFRIFVRLFGDVARYDEPEDREFYRLQKYEKLGLDPDIQPTLVLPEDPSTVVMNYFRAKGEERSWRSILGDRNYWTLEEYPMLADWVHGIDAPLDAIAEAIHKPVFFFPLLRDRGSMQSGIPQGISFSSLSDSMLFRNIARIFQARAFYRIGQGDIDGAIDDKLTLHQLGRQMTRSSLLSQSLMGMGNEGIAWSIPIGANPDHPLTEQQIRRLLEELNALPLRTSSADMYEQVRYEILDSVQNFHITVTQKKMLFSEALAECFDINVDNPIISWMFADAHLHTLDWNTIYRQMNDLWDAMQEPSVRTKYASILDETEQPSGGEILSCLLTPGGKEALLVRLIVAQFITSEMHNFESWTHLQECWENMQRLALAILLYELEHGTMPGEDWAVQIGEYLGKDAERYFSCPLNPSPKGCTTYALIHYGDTVPGSLGTLLLLELNSPVPMGEAIMTVDEVITFVDGDRVFGQVEAGCCGRTWMEEGVVAGTSQLTAHRGGANTAHRSGAVRFMPQTIAKEELLRLLGRGAAVTIAEKQRDKTKKDGKGKGQDSINSKNSVAVTIMALFFSACRIFARPAFSPTTKCVTCWSRFFVALPPIDPTISIASSRSISRPDVFLSLPVKAKYVFWKRLSFGRNRNSSNEVGKTSGFPIFSK